MAVSVHVIITSATVTYTLYKNYTITPGNFAQALTLLTYVRKVPGSNLDCDTDILTDVLHILTHSL
jgi:hypothetical protein